MSVDGWNTALVLGGIRSGKSAFAAALLADEANVRCVVAAADGPSTGGPVATELRRPGWMVEQSGEPTRLIHLIADAAPGETLLIDDLAGWVRRLIEVHSPTEVTAAIDRLASAVHACRARLVLVSAEAGLTAPAALAAADRVFVDTLATLNLAVARACDTVTLVVAGQPIRLRPSAQVPQPVAGDRSAAPTQPVPSIAADSATGRQLDVPAPAAAADAWTAPTAVLPVMSGAEPVFEPGMDLPLPDEGSAAQALDRLATLDFPGGGLGALERVVAFAAGAQGTSRPVPWRVPRVLLLHGDHDGGVAAGAVPGESTRRAEQARVGEGALARLAAAADADLRIVPAPTAAPIEHGPALSPDDVEAALRLGWRLAEEAADEGVDLLVLGACGGGVDAAVAAVLAATSGAEPSAVLPRVLTPGGTYDDTAWMTRCAAVRDALHRTRRSPRGAKDVLAELGGGDLAIATGVLLGATARRTPVLVDGPVGVAAGLVSRALAGQTRHWCLLPDHGGHPAVRYAADVLGWTPAFDLRLGLGEGATALATLPMLRSALALAAAVPAHPFLAADTAAGRPGPADGAEFIEPEPAGPGPTTTGGTASAPRI